MNPYPAKFLELYDQLPDDGLAVDLGCGPARPDTGQLVQLVNVDLAPAADLPRGLAGDVGRYNGVPLGSGTVDLVLSAAVLEHVPDPTRHLAEAARILKPGGLLYVDGASMQPLHRVPGHYFGVYPDGLALLLDRTGFDVVEAGTSGRLADQVTWIRDMADPEGIGGDWWTQLGMALAALYELPGVQSVLATGTWAVARKRVTR